MGRLVRSPRAAALCPMAAPAASAATGPQPAMLSLPSPPAGPPPKSFDAWEFPTRRLAGADAVLARIYHEHTVSKAYTPLMLGEILAASTWTSADELNKLAAGGREASGGALHVVAGAVVATEVKKAWEPRGVMAFIDGLEAVRLAWILTGLGEEEDVDAYIAWWDKKARARAVNMDLDRHDARHGNAAAQDLQGGHGAAHQGGEQGQGQRAAASPRARHGCGRPAPPPPPKKFKGEKGKKGRKGEGLRGGAGKEAARPKAQTSATTPSGALGPTAPGMEPLRGGRGTTPATTGRRARAAAASPRSRAESARSFAKRPRLSTNRPKGRDIILACKALVQKALPWVEHREHHARLPAGCRRACARRRPQCRGYGGLVCGPAVPGLLPHRHSRSGTSGRQGAPVRGVRRLRSHRFAFLYENVEMGAEAAKVSSDALGVQPVFVCSSDFGWVSRPRLWWLSVDWSCLASDPADAPGVGEEGAVGPPSFGRCSAIGGCLELGGLEFHSSVAQGRGLMPCATTPAPTDDGRAKPRSTRGRRWMEGGRQFAPWHYTVEAMLQDFKGVLHIPPPELKEQLHHIPGGYTAKPGADVKTRHRMVGNGWHWGVASRLLGARARSQFWARGGGASRPHHDQSHKSWARAWTRRAIGWPRPVCSTRWSAGRPWNRHWKPSWSAHQAGRSRTGRWWRTVLTTRPPGWAPCPTTSGHLRHQGQAPALSGPGVRSPAPRRGLPCGR